MGKSNNFKTEYLKKIFNDIELPWLPLEKFFISLYTDDPGVSGNQSINECDYSGYKRVEMPRDSNTWKISGGQVKNNITIVFPTCNSGTNIAKYFAIGTEKIGQGKIIYSNALSSNITITLNVSPRFSSNSIIITEI